MIEGLLRHLTSTDVDRQYTDTHGAFLVGQVSSHLLGFRLLPRYNLSKARLYRPEAGSADAWLRLGTDHPNVCHYLGLVWISRLGHAYHHHPPAIIDPLLDPLPRDRAPYPLVTPLDESWEDTQIWAELPSEPEPPPEPDPPPEPEPDPPPEPEPDPPPEPEPGADDPPF